MTQSQSKSRNMRLLAFCLAIALVGNIVLSTGLALAETEQVSASIDMAAMIADSPVPDELYQGERVDLSDIQAMMDNGTMPGNPIVGILAVIGAKLLDAALTKVSNWVVDNIFKSIWGDDDEPDPQEQRHKEIMGELSKIQSTLRVMDEKLSAILQKLDAIIKKMEIEPIRQMILRKQAEYRVVSTHVEQYKSALIKGTDKKSQQKILSSFYNSTVHGAANALQMTVNYAKALMDNQLGYSMFAAYDKFIELSNYSWEAEAYSFRLGMRVADLSLFYESAMMTSLYLRDQLEQHPKDAQVLSDIEMLNKYVKAINEYAKLNMAPILPDGYNRFIGNGTRMPMMHKTNASGMNADAAIGVCTTDPRTWTKSLSGEKGTARPIAPSEVAAILKYYGSTDLKACLEKGGIHLNTDAPIVLARFDDPFFAAPEPPRDLENAESGGKHYQDFTFTLPAVNPRDASRMLDIQVTYKMQLVGQPAVLAEVKSGISAAHLYVEEPIRKAADAVLTVIGEVATFGDDYITLQTKDDALITFWLEDTTTITGELIIGSRADIAYVVLPGDTSADDAYTCRNVAINILVVPPMVAPFMVHGTVDLLAGNALIVTDRDAKTHSFLLGDVAIEGLLEEGAEVEINGHTSALGKRQIADSIVVTAPIIRPFHTVGSVAEVSDTHLTILEDRGTSVRFLLQDTDIEGDLIVDAHATVIAHNDGRQYIADQVTCTNSPQPMPELKEIEGKVTKLSKQSLTLRGDDRKTYTFSLQGIDDWDDDTIPLSIVHVIYHEEGKRLLANQVTLIEAPMPGPIDPEPKPGPIDPDPRPGPIDPDPEPDDPSDDDEPDDALTSAR